MTPLAHKWDPGRGKWKLRQVIRGFLEESPRPVTENALLRHLTRMGYHPATTKRILPQFVDVDVEGHVALRRWG